jgi:hypothetical protein
MALAPAFERDYGGSIGEGQLIKGCLTCRTIIA